jgi:hypothetical protein
MAEFVGKHVRSSQKKECRIQETELRRENGYRKLPGFRISLGSKAFLIPRIDRKSVV